VLCSAVILTGCGSDPTADLGDPVEVTGKITLDGQPAKGIEVIFNRSGGGAPAEYRNYTAVTDESGNYKIANVYPAEYRVMVYEKKTEAQEAEGAAAVDTGPYAKYGIDSTLTANVSEQQTTQNFELMSK
jgi:hypothetical protein